MKGTTHALTGQVFWLATGSLVHPLHTRTDWVVFVVGFVWTTWGGYGPDIDHMKSTIAYSLPFGRHIGRAVAKATDGHRMGTHSALSVVVVWCAMFGLISLAGLFGRLPPSAAWTMAWAFAIGWAGHIFGDLLTVYGVGLLYPLTRRRVRLLRLRTSPPGRLYPGEAVFRAVLVLAGCWSMAALLGGVTNAPPEHHPAVHHAKRIADRGDALRPHQERHRP